MSRAVIDQPGLRIVTFGLLVALILGLILRSQISSKHVEQSLQKSIQILEKDFRIEFDLAEVRLSKWGFPLPHLVISKLRISPKKNFCQSSQVYIDELEIPLQFKNIFAAEKTVDLIRAKNVEIRLVDLETCLSKDKKARGTAVATANSSSDVTAKSAPGSENPASAPAAAMSAPATLFSQRTGTRLKEIAIDQLKIITLKNYEQPVVFKQLKFFLNYEDSRLSQIDIKTRLYSIKDSRTDIYFLISDLNAHIKPDAQKNIELTLELKGRLLDGDIQVFLQASTQNQKANYEVSTHHVSLKAYAPLLTRGGKENPFDRWPLSTSFYMIGEAQQTNELKSIFKFKNFEAVGENMRIDFPEVNFELANGKTVLRPFQLSLNHIPLTPLKLLLAEQYDFQSVENLGVIDGLLKFEDQSHWNFEGQIQKTELIFSNRGSREIEQVDSVGVKLDYAQNKLDFSLDDLVIHQNEIVGGLEGTYTKNPQSLELKLDIEGQVLNEKIWKQLTQVSQNPSVKLSWSYKKSNEERHQIKIHSPELELQGLHLNDVQIDFAQLVADETRSLALSLKTGHAELRGPELNANFSRAFFNQDTGLSPDENYSALKTQMSLQGSDWKNMSFELDSNLYDAAGTKMLEHLHGKGEWKSDNVLVGTATLQNPKRSLRYHLVKRNKEEVDFIPEKKAE